MFLSYNSSHLTQDRTNSQISLRGHPLEKRTKVDYLEITIDDKLSFADHVFKTTDKAYGTLKTLNRARIFLPLTTRRLLYNALVRPHLCTAPLSQIQL